MYYTIAVEILSIEYEHSIDIHSKFAIETNVFHNIYIVSRYMYSSYVAARERVLDQTD